MLRGYEAHSCEHNLNIEIFGFPSFICAIKTNVKVLSLAHRTSRVFLGRSCDGYGSSSVLPRQFLLSDSVLPTAAA